MPEKNLNDRLREIKKEKALLQQKINETIEMIDMLEDIQVLEGKNHSRENIEYLKNKKELIFNEIEKLERNGKI